jgi:hypothetical protein
MRYPISFNPMSAVVLGILGGGPSRSHVDVMPEKIVATMGWLGKLSINREDLVAAEKVEHVPWWMGLGVHGIPGTMALNGSMGNAVKISTRTANPGKGKILFFSVRPHTIYLTVERADEFIFELGY